MPGEVRRVVRAWNLMGGRIDWAALPVVAALVDAQDVETFIEQLDELRDGLGSSSE